MAAVDNGIWYVWDHWQLKLASDATENRYTKGSKNPPFSGADPKEYNSVYYADFVGPPAVTDLTPWDGVFAVIDKDNQFSKGDKLTYSTPVRIYASTFGFFTGGRGVSGGGASPDTDVYLSKRNTAAEIALDYTYIWEFVKLRDQTTQANDSSTIVNEGDEFFIRTKDNNTGTYLYLKRQPGSNAIFTNPGSSPMEKIGDYKWSIKFTFRNH